MSEKEGGKRAVNSVTSDKSPPSSDNAVASIRSPAAALAPPAQENPPEAPPERKAPTEAPPVQKPPTEATPAQKPPTEATPAQKPPTEAPPAQKKPAEASIEGKKLGEDNASNDDGLCDEAVGGEPFLGVCDNEFMDDYGYVYDDDDYGLSSSGSDDGNEPYACMEKRDANDFIFGKLIGEGSFSTVYLAKDIHTQKEFAIKVCRKTHIIREKKVEYIKREKEILSLLSAKCNPTAPFFVKLYCTFQDKIRLYFVLSYAKYGDLLSHINKVGSFDTACTQFYSAEILLALEHMHSLGIVHRDLKPENILLDGRMHIKITDFGSAKMFELDENGQPYPTQRKNSFVGTAQYIPPDLLMDTAECSRSSDLWAYGAIIYQMVAGLPPFRSNSEYLIFKQIRNVDYNFPDGFCPCARDLVQKILVADPKKRLGALDGKTYDSIRAHEFFSEIVFETLSKQEPPQIYPYLPGTSEHEELRSHYKVPDYLEPGLDDRQITRLLGLELQGTSPPRVAAPEPPVEKTRKKSGLGLRSLSPQDIEVRLSEQRFTAGRWHNLCDGNLIVKQGLVDKRKGLFARRRMLMLTLGPHLYYADPVSMVLKGEIPWSEELRVEPKNFKIFFVHTPNRTYYLEDPEGYALEWCKAIEEVRVHTYGGSDPPKRDPDRKA